MKTNVFKNLKQTMFLFLVALCSFIGIAQTTQPHVIINPIGGSKTPEPEVHVAIGENKTPTGEIKYDIGGRGDVGTGLLVIGGKSTDVNDIGGRQEVPTLPYGYEIGGRDSSGGLGSYATNYCQDTNNDIGGRGTGSDSGVGQNSYDIALATIFDIGGRNTGGEITCDIGGRSQDPLFFVISDFDSTTALGLDS